MAIAALQKVNADREMRQLIEAREKARHDEATRFAEAELRGKVLGLAEGLKQGVEQGLKQGVEQGLKQGVEQGLKQGVEQGKKQGMLLLARKLLAKGTSLAEIVELSGLSESEIRAAGFDIPETTRVPKVQEEPKPLRRSKSRT